jgi:cytochrome b561
MTQTASDTAASERRYAAVAIGLHWLIAALIAANILIAWGFEDLKGLAKFNQMQLHKSVGITVLILSLGRLGWRLTHRPPPLPAHMPRWEKIAAHAVHWGFYVIMIGLPVTGWIIVSASPSNIPTLLYQTIPWPHLEFVHGLPMADRKGIDEAMEETHELLGKLTYALIVLHVAAALKHQFWNKDGLIWRMAPFAALKAKAKSSGES